ncbi:MAG: GNAT family N-acetyltransferase [Leptolyngbya sp.]|nr:MAG: GNAT family N-acetyltransferase [Leptolyngbya sp.]
MTQSLPQPTEVLIRPVQYGDIETADRLCDEAEGEELQFSINPDKPLKPLRWYAPWRFLSFLVNRSHLFGAYIFEQDSKLRGIVKISPFNRTRTTWRVDRVAVVEELASVEDSAIAIETAPLPLSDIGSHLLRYCFETVWEARTWLLEVNVNDNELLALYRQNGFQSLANITYWEIDPALLQNLAEREPDLPNLLPVSNADAQLLYQLDTMFMPPLVRQVFDRHLSDFKTSLIDSVLNGVKNWVNQLEVVSGYIFESQRKAAIGYFQIQLCRDGSRPHQAQLTVNPSYTWLYPELMSQMARITQELPSQSLQLASYDYQPEREEYLKQLGADRIAHTLMMSRSVWHKVRESRLSGFENLQLPEVLQGLQPRKQPIPSRINLQSTSQALQQPQATVKVRSKGSSKLIQPKNAILNLSSKTDFSDHPPEGPCC